MLKNVSFLNEIGCFSIFIRFYPGTVLEVETIYRKEQQLSFEIQMMLEEKNVEVKALEERNLALREKVNDSIPETEHNKSVEKCSRCSFLLVG